LQDERSAAPAVILRTETQGRTWPGGGCGSMRIGLLSPTGLLEAKGSEIFFK
jgi:hypothetical protein